MPCTPLVYNRYAHSVIDIERFLKISQGVDFKRDGCTLLLEIVRKYHFEGLIILTAVVPPDITAQAYGSLIENGVLNLSGLLYLFLAELRLGRLV